MKNKTVDYQRTVKLLGLSSSFKILCRNEKLSVETRQAVNQLFSLNTKLSNEEKSSAKKCPLEMKNKTVKPRKPVVKACLRSPQGCQ